MMKKEKNKMANSWPNLSHNEHGAPANDASSADVPPEALRHIAKRSPNKPIHLVVVGMILIAVGSVAFLGCQKKANTPETKPVVVERGESINSPEPQRSAAVTTKSSSTAVKMEDPVLYGIPQGDSNPYPKSVHEKNQSPSNNPTAQTLASQSLTQITNEKAWNQLESADRLKLTKLEQASSASGSNVLDRPLLKIGEYSVAGFNVLSSFHFEVKPEMFLLGENSAAVTAAISEQIPEKIKALHEKPVAAQGFMMPIKGSFGRWTEFLLVKNRANCCYGQTPKPTEWVMVRAAGDGVDYIKDEVVTVFGTLRVGNIREQGAFAGIYQMDCDKIELAK